MALHIYEKRYSDFINISPSEIDPIGMYILDNGMFFMGKRMYGVETYIFEQIQSSSVWIINHPLKKFPSINVVDTGGNLVIGDVEYISDSKLIVTFSSEFSGKAYLN